MNIERVMTAAPVIPVLVIDDVKDAVPIAEALVKGGLTVLEVTLRTDAALDVIRAMTSVEGAIVGAGTVMNQREMDAAQEAGATFCVSPGLTEPLGRHAKESGMPLLPGVATPADLMRGMDMGFERFKFFPAEPLGGMAMLKALAGPFDDVKFCPTGGITLESAPEWLAHPQVVCVGGSWPVADPDPAAVEAAARKAAALERSL